MRSDRLQSHLSHNIARTEGAPHRPRPSFSSIVLGSSDCFELEDEGRVRAAFAILLVLAVGGLFAGCTHTPRLSGSERTAIYGRADIHFDKTVLLKPAESDQPEFKFAPLLVQAVSDTNAVLNLPYSVYFWKTRALGSDSLLEQFNYVWFLESRENRARLAQGVRITFDAGGKPILWEILRDPSGARLLFVGQPLEAAAMTNYPAPLPERRFWVERGIEEMPDLAVARILDDGPAPMGPIVYLDEDSHRVSTLICRCMDAQAEEVVGISVYGLATLNEAAVNWLVRDKTPGLTRWLPGRPADDLTQWLRAEVR